MRSRGSMFVIGPLVTHALFPDREQLRNSRVFKPVPDVLHNREAEDRSRRFQMKKVAPFLLPVVPVLILIFFAALNPPKVQALPSYARQTGLACSGCHYAPPELNPA